MFNFRRLGALVRSCPSDVGALQFQFGGAPRRWNSAASNRGMSDLSKWLISSGLGQYCEQLQSHNFNKLQQMMSLDRDRLYDILIDAGMKTGDRKMFLTALQKELVDNEVAATSSDTPFLKQATRTTVSYLLSPSYFQGPWSLERQIWRTGERAGLVAMCEGKGSFSEEGYDQEVSTGSETKKWLSYQESGEQMLSADPTHGLQPQKGSFRASYIYQHSLMQDRVDIFFDRTRGSGPWPDDRFCSFNLACAEFGVGLKSTSHFCGGDQYDGEFMVTDADSWMLRYTVTGSTKAMVIETKYRRRMHLESDPVALPHYY